MGNKQIRQPVLLLQILQKVQNLRLNGHIQCGNRLIAYNKLGIQCQRPGHTDSLSAAAIQLVGIGLLKPFCQSNRIHQLGYSGVQLLFRAAYMIDLQWLRDQLPHTHSRVQGRHGVLKNHLHISSNLLLFSAARFADILAVQKHLTGGGRHQSQNGSAQCGFSAAGFSHHTQCLLGTEGERHVIHCVEAASGGLEILFQMLYFQ